MIPLIPTCYVTVLLVLVVKKSAAQSSSPPSCSCIPVLPKVIPATGGDTPGLAEGHWYLYRQMGGAVTVNPRMLITNIIPTGQVLNVHGNVTQLWQTTLYPDTVTYPCQQRFWIGTYQAVGQQIGLVSSSADNYVPHPSSYMVLYREYQQTMIMYSCQNAKVDGSCATPQIRVLTRIRPDELSPADATGLDGLVNGIFSKYCVNITDIPRQVFTNQKPLCPFMDPPQCVNRRVQSITNNAMQAIFNPPATTSSSCCKWPNSVPPQGKFPTVPVGIIWWVYRRRFPPGVAVSSQQFRYTAQGSIPVENSNDRATIVLAEFISFSTMLGTCTGGYNLVQISASGFKDSINGASDQNAESFTQQTLYMDDRSILYYSCTSPNNQTGECNLPLPVHLTRTYPPLLSQAERDVLDALESAFFNKYGCSAADTPLVPYPSYQFSCPFIPLDECTEKSLTGLQQAVATNIAASKGPTYTPVVNTPAAPNGYHFPFVFAWNG